MKYERLGQHILQIRGVSYKPEDIITEYLNGYVPIIKSNNITEEGFYSKELIYIKKSHIRYEQFIKKGDLILTASSGSKKTIGKNIQFDEDYDGSFGAFCKLIRPKLTVNQKFIYHFFKTRFFRNSIENAVQGANISNLKNEYIDNLQIPLPPLDDQIRIADILTRAENLIAKRKESIKALDELLKSTFLEMFGDYGKMLQEPKKRLGDFVSFLTSGSRGWAQFYSETGSIFIRINNVRNASFKLEDIIYVTPPNNAEALRTKVMTNDLLFSITADLGRTAVVNESLNGSFINQHLALIRLKHDEINPIFVAWYFAMPYGKSIVMRKNREGVKAGLNFDDIRGFEIVTPPINLQNQFAAIVEKVESLKTKYQQNLDELEKLYGSLSQQAFSGEMGGKLYPTSPTESVE